MASNKASIYSKLQYLKAEVEVYVCVLIEVLFLCAIHS